MQKYYVTIVETLEKQIIVPAKSGDEAIEKAKNIYFNEELVLDWSDHTNTEFEFGGEIE